MLRNTLPLLVLLAASAAGCAPSDLSQPENICQAAADHLTACMDMPQAAPSSGCDEEQANEIWNLDCQELRESSYRQDWFEPGTNTFFCDLGWLQFCVVPECPTRISSASDCSDYLTLGDCGACDYYDCREAESEAQCGEEGYYLGFGARHCKSLSIVTAPELSLPGQTWLGLTRQCLLDYAEAEIEQEATCDTIKRKALNSHIDCYVDSGFCDLPFVDYAMLGLSIFYKDLDFNTVMGTGVSCFNQLFD